MDSRTNRNKVMFRGGGGVKEQLPSGGGGPFNLAATKGSHTSIARPEELEKFTNPKQLDVLVDMMSPGKFAKKVGGALGGKFVPSGAGNDDYVSDPVLIADFVQKMDEHVKLLLLFMMFLGTLIWAVFFYWWYHLPRELFAWIEIQNVFLPTTYWSGIYILIAGPIVAGIYCLFVVVYPDPRKWRFCIRPRRPVRWLPYIFLLIYTTIVKAFWFYNLFLIPSSLRMRMKAKLKTSLTRANTPFPIEWTYIHNYYQCCGMDSKQDWEKKFMGSKEIPYPFKYCDEAKSSFKYGLLNPKPASSQANCSSGNITALGILWPASCCNNETNGCTILPTNNQLWHGRCHTSETSLCMCVIALAMLLSIAINVLGVFAFFKTRILETVALRQKLQAPEPHF